VRDALMIYFDGEKVAGLFLTALGLVGVGAAALFLQPRWGLRSLAVTLGLFALLQLAIGVGLVLRTGPQVEALLAQLGSDAPRFYADEGARMARVQKNFVVIESVWLTLIVAAAVTAFTQKSRPTLTGVALGVLITSALLLAFDLVAERRGAVYLAALERRGELTSPR